MRGFNFIGLITYICLLCIALPSSYAQVNTPVSDDYVETKYRQFDFWIGSWDVNLRMIQGDNTWKDAVKSEAHIYRILDGKAILELWNEKKQGQGIKGYSLRYFNAAKDKWELWLNWPGKNQSGSTSLEGDFRHGRGDFFSERQLNDSTSLISRYSFNDITPSSLRWDDAYSRDGGKTWTNNWIMEFSRVRDLAPAFRLDVSLLTYDNGGRCDQSEFRTFENVVGEWEGTMKVMDSDQSFNISLKAFKALDGCAVLTFSDYIMNGKLYKSFGHLTYNTYAGVYEEGFLDSSDSPFKIYYGSQNGNQISLMLSQKMQGIDSSEKSEWTISEDEIIWRVYSKSGEKWDLKRETFLTRM